MPLFEDSLGRSLDARVVSALEKLADTYAKQMKLAAVAVRQAVKAGEAEGFAPDLTDEERELLELNPSEHIAMAMSELVAEETPEDALEAEDAMPGFKPSPATTTPISGMRYGKDGPDLTPQED